MIKFKSSYIRAIACASIMTVLCAAPSVSSWADRYWEQKTTLFELLPIDENDIVFLGNSITDGGEFHELFQMENIKNRGIISDIMPGVEKRLEQVTKGKPKKIFLLIGINDVSHGHSVDKLAARYESLVKKIRQQTPDTKLYVQSVMPINNSFKRYKALTGKEKTIKLFNERIKKIASENDAVYVDLWPFLSDSKGNLKREYTNDGLHLNGPGYRAWTDGIRDLVKE